MINANFLVVNWNFVDQYVKYPWRNAEYVSAKGDIFKKNDKNLKENKK